MGISWEFWMNIQHFFLFCSFSAGVSKEKMTRSNMVKEYGLNSKEHRISDTIFGTLFPNLSYWYHPLPAPVTYLSRCEQGKPSRTQTENTPLNRPHTVFLCWNFISSPNLFNHLEASFEVPSCGQHSWMSPTPRVSLFLLCVCSKNTFLLCSHHLFAFCPLGQGIKYTFGSFQYPAEFLALFRWLNAAELN